MDEAWQIITDYPNYAISNHGRVKRLVARTCARAGAILKTPPRSKCRPYPCVDLCNGGKKKTIFVHTLVAMAFLPRPNFEGAEVNHIDGDKANPMVSNLEWTTSSENSLHSYQHGLQTAVGESNGQSKLTEENVKEIRSGYERPEFYADKYGVDRVTVLDVLARRTWRHVS